MVRTLYNSTTTDQKITTVIEFMQVSKLGSDGMVQFIDLSEMRPRRIDGGRLVEHGVPIEIDLNQSEYLVAVSRAKVVKRGGAVQYRVHLYNADPQTMPAQGFIGFFGDHEGRKGTNYWRFPQLDFVGNLNELMFGGGMT
jgi:hypothetical protein